MEMMTLVTEENYPEMQTSMAIVTEENYPEMQSAYNQVGNLLEADVTPTMACSDKWQCTSGNRRIVNLDLKEEESESVSAYREAEDICNTYTPKRSASIRTLVDFPIGDEKIENEQDLEDDDYGEPLREQHLIIDFSPTDSAEDSEYNMQKCVDFWNFLSAHPELHHLKVNPKIVFQGSEQTDSWSSTASGLSSTSEDTNSAMRWMHRNNFMKGAFMTKKNEVHCNDRKRFGWQASNNTVSGEEVKEEKSPDLKTEKKKKVPKKETISTSSREVQRVLADMEAWDLNHPKSYDPPGRPPTLNSAKLVREGRFYWDRESI